MNVVEHVQAMSRERRALETGRILGKLEADPSSVSLEELGRVDMNYVDEYPSRRERLRRRFSRD